MKTKLGRPVLVESKEKLAAGQLAILDNKLITVMSEFQIFAKPQQLIMVSLEPDEKIEVGEYYIHRYDNHSEMVQNTSGRSYGGKPKVIALQSQISPEDIQRCIDEYNGGEMKEVEIEMEAVPNEFDNPITNPEGLENFEGSKWELKLTNGFINIINN